MIDSSRLSTDYIVDTDPYHSIPRNTQYEFNSILRTSTERGP